MTLTEIWNFTLIDWNGHTIALKQLVIAIAILMISRMFMRVIRGYLLKRIFKYTKTDIGRRFAIQTFITYVIWLIAGILSLRALGFELQGLWVGSAALLVGVGIGLQQTFNDLLSGIIILTGSTVEVGDIVVVDEIVGKVQKIGVRTSTVTTRNNVSIIIPNSKLVVDNVINWSHSSSITRFDLRVGVAYGSDTQLVKKLLLQVAEEHEKSLDKPEPVVHFADFGASSLDFILYFYSLNFFEIENVKSDMRFRVDEIFREHQVEIPFPQRDLWIRNPASLRPAPAEASNGATVIKNAPEGLLAQGE